MVGRIGFVEKTDCKTTEKKKRWTVRVVVVVGEMTLHEWDEKSVKEND